MNWAPHTKARIMPSRAVPLATCRNFAVEDAKNSGTGLFLQLSTKSFKPAGGALFPPTRLLMAIEERTGFGEEQTRPVAGGTELDGRHRHRHEDSLPLKGWMSRRPSPH